MSIVVFAIPLLNWHEFEKCIKKIFQTKPLGEIRPEPWQENGRNAERIENVYIRVAELLQHSRDARENEESERMVETTNSYVYLETVEENKREIQ